MPVPNINSGLIYHWLLDGDATDETGTLDLTEYGGISYTADVPSVLSGVVTQSVDLDGASDYLNTAININFKSVSCWFKIDSFTSQSRIFDFGSNGCSPICRTSGAIEHVYRDAGVALSFMSAKTGLPAGVWNHVVWSGDSVNNSIYFNGALHNTTSDGFTTINAIFNVGRYGSGGDNFKGHLSDVRLYSIPLTSSDVTSIYAVDYGGGGGGPAFQPGWAKFRNSKIFGRGLI